MRSVVVVLPASMCAMMPMFRVLSNGYCLAMVFSLRARYSRCRNQPAIDTQNPLRTRHHQRDQPPSGCVSFEEGLERHSVAVTTLNHSRELTRGAVFIECAFGDGRSSWRLSLCVKQHEFGLSSFFERFPWTCSKVILRHHL